MSCSQFAKRFPKVGGKTWKEKAEEACAGCGTCDGNIPDEPLAGDEEDQYGLVLEEIADIVAWDDAGFVTDWSIYPFEILQLYRLWRETEKEVDELRQNRMQVFLKSWFKE